MFDVTFYKFHKRENSTARPSGGDTFQCVLKSGSAVFNPIITLDYGLAAAPVYNMCYIPAFERYYWVSEWSWIENRLWSAQLVCDVLATARDRIGASSLYVLRSAAAYDGAIVDTLYPVAAGITETNVQLLPDTADFASTLANGCYVLGVLNGQASSGGVTYYVMTNAQFNALKDYMYADAATESGGWLEELANEIGTGLAKEIFSPLDYFASCKWFPVMMPHTSPAVPIKIGYHTLGNVEGYLMSNDCVKIDTAWTCTVPKHPLAATRGKYMNLAPYSRYRLFFQPFGVLDLDTSMLVDADMIVLVATIDGISGTAFLTAGYTGATDIICASAMVAVDIPLSQSGVQPISALAGTVQAGAAIGMAIAAPGAGTIAGAIVGGVNGIGSAVNAATGSNSTMGGASGVGCYKFSRRLVADFYYMADEDNEHNGRPLMQTRQISTLPGYNVVKDGDVATSLTATENATIKSYLEGGFFYE